MNDLAIMRIGARRLQYHAFRLSNHAPQTVQLALLREAFTLGVTTAVEMYRPVLRDQYTDDPMRLAMVEHGTPEVVVAMRDFDLTWADLEPQLPPLLASGTTLFDLVHEMLYKGAQFGVMILRAELQLEYQKTAPNIADQYLAYWQGETRLWGQLMSQLADVAAEM